MQVPAIGSRIRAVSVYRQGARVTRVAEVAGSAAGLPVNVRLTGLPMAMDDASIRVAVESAGGSGATGGGLPVATDVRVALEVPELDPSLAPADDAELKEVRSKAAHLRSQAAQLERELTRVSNLRVTPRPPGPEGEPPVESPTRARLLLLELREQREQKLRDELARTRERLDAVTRRREELEDRDLRASTARQARAHELRKTVQVSLRGGADQAGARLSIEYLVPGARWAPAYTATLDDEMLRASLSFRAVVAQNTGEDWNGIELTLSTADAQRWTELPELNSLRIGRRQTAAPKLGWRSPPTGVEELYRDYDRAFDQPLTVPEPWSTLRVDDAAPLEPFDTDSEDTGRVAMKEYSVALGVGADFDEAETAVAPPTPSPGAAPQSVAEPMPAYSGPPPSAIQTESVMHKKSRFGIGGLFSRSREEEVDGLVMDDFAANRAMPPPEQAARAGFVSHGAVGCAGLDDEVGLQASDEMLAYGMLRMQSATNVGRGKLTVVAEQEVYLELLARQRISVSVDDVRTALREAAVRTRAVEHAEMPPRCRPAWSEEYDYAYVAESPIDVPSDGEFHSIPISASDAEAKPMYVVVPRESTDVYRTVAVENPLEAPLLAGPIDVYWRGDFLLTSDVELTPPRAKLQLGLGVEQAIKVSRNTRYREESAGLIGGSLDLHHQIRIEALNHTERKVALEVRERIPVLRDDEEEIRFELDEVSPDWEGFDPFPDTAEAPELRGGHRWRVEIAPAETQSFRVDYTVRISAKHELVGGNRREV